MLMGDKGCRRADRVTRRSVLAGAAALAATSCGPRSASPPLRFWATSYEGDYAPHLMTAFTAATGIEVDVQSIPSTAAHEKMLTAFAGDALPDVFALPSGWIGEFQMIGALAPVPSPDYVADVLPPALALAQVKGRNFAVPWSAAPQVQFYRRDLLRDAGYETPPDTWEAWREMGRTIKRRRPDEFVFLTLLNWPDTLFSMLYQTGMTMLRDQDTRGNFRSPEAESAFAFYLSLFTENLAPRALSTEVQDAFAAFAQGRYAVWPSWPSLLLDLHRRRAEIPRERWGVARLAGPKGPGPTAMIASNVVVSARTAQPQAAWALVRHLTSTATELRFQQLIGNLPARASAWASPQLQMPVLRPFAEQMRQPAMAPKIVEWERIQIEVQLVAERVVRGLLTIPHALAAIDGRVDQILAKRRALVEAGRIA
ncbi:multiple sugar transport system substrate-binding protein [Novosphingobium chloroacetimidivorans]|uniref:Multiple sugar transport system substrate-binding protein n=1 Tax=Novosphingobium chloroacetimidivorans TaxID=1428314 RepID=A0A7W7NWR5_9SPHN|nr:extracellular solute-binding protein [Novosphingobium chloroacetimidivorans]MBB4858694.1 multiple sugar transport system substrate-binding protein [Novosphingobium chloroacetimidivorans]